jgi:hypothetical protein
MGRGLLGIALIGLAAVGVVACAQKTPVNLDAFERRTADGTVAIYWNCKQTDPGRLVVEGVVNNPYYPVPITGVELFVSGVDGQGRDLSNAKATTAAYQIYPMTPSPFRVDLRLAGGEQRFDLRYQYRGAPGGGTSTGGSQTGTVTNSLKDICGSLRK